jgi:hypothetical protein
MVLDGLLAILVWVFLSFSLFFPVVSFLPVICLGFFVSACVLFVLFINTSDFFLQDVKEISYCA